MRKILVVLLILLVCKNVSYAFKDDSSNYKPLFKEYITEVVFSAMETCNESSSKKISDGELEGIKSFKKLYYSQSQWEYKVLYDFLINNSWTGLSKKLFTKWKNQLEVSDFFSEEEFDRILDEEENYPFSVTKNSNTILMFLKKIEGIKKKYRQKAIEIRVDKIESNEDDLQEQVKEVKKERRQDSFLLNWLHFLLFFLTIGITAVCYFLYQAKEKYKNECEKLRNKKVLLKTIPKKRNVKTHIERSKTLDRLDTLSRDNDVNRSKIDYCKVENKAAVGKEIHSKYIEEKIPQFKSSMMYFEDFVDGIFEIRDGRKQKSAWSIFCITTTSESEACLDMLYEEMAQEIIADKQIYLRDSICEVKYKEGGNMNEIIRAQSGKVVLHGSKWQVVEKIKVEIN